MENPHQNSNILQRYALSSQIVRNMHLDCAEEIALWIPRLAQLSAQDAEDLACGVWLRLYHMLSSHSKIKYFDCLNEAGSCDSEGEQTILQWIPALSMARDLNISRVMTLLWIKRTCILVCIGRLDTNDVNNLHRLPISGSLYRNLSSQMLIVPRTLNSVQLS